jgi:molybdenum cofactor cytidylyltransferase
MAEITAIVLAAGESLRMKKVKMLLPFKGKTIIEKVLENIALSEVNRTIVVLGANGDQILKVVEPLGTMHCFNDEYREGMLSSVKCGLRSSPGESEAVMVFLGDQPMIGPDIINDIIQIFIQTEKGIIIPVFNNRRGHPVLICSKYADDIERSDNRYSLRDFIEKFKDDVLEVAINSPVILRDIDTEEDYLKEIN